MNVLSLFDGISVGQLALRSLYPNITYFASEVDKNAIKITQRWFPQTIQLGDITKWNEWDLPEIDLIIGGSPCQGFSFAGKELNFQDSRSKLFFDFVNVCSYFKPKYFLLENVVMRKEYENVITQYLGVNPVIIDSALLSAQSRKRLYWSNFSINQPTDRGILFSDKINGFPARMVGRRLKDGKRDDYNYSIPLIQYIECRKDNKSSCVTTVSKDCLVASAFVERLPAAQCKFRTCTVEELEWLQTLPLGYTQDISNSQRLKVIGNAWTLDVMRHIFSTMPP